MNCHRDKSIILLYVCYNQSTIQEFQHLCYHGINIQQTRSEKVDKTIHHFSANMLAITSPNNFVYIAYVISPGYGTCGDIQLYHLSTRKCSIHFGKQKFTFFFNQK